MKCTLINVINTLFLCNYIHQKVVTCEHLQQACLMSELSISLQFIMEALCLLRRT
ncbi:hypothetical protein XBKQ1_1280027 [Xenorhabdus bovienii str. kraussei Quebec]|uniref:Uncharacterized protein n=1 Tax=Xenorhabdus bovienii str. kraussei Quebec TaxID=1398203 RepID=A0A077PCR3_XENBV|nr:hypothetical protein XBKQ1_1280027 [Xenorhabdus bovienii str. kraussei Quebec]